jgi:hypothetical protein
VNNLLSKIFFLVLIVAVLATHASVAQVQLVLLKNERVVLRLNPGDEFVYKLKHSKSVKKSYVNNLSDTSVSTHHDVVPFHTIDRIYFQKSTFYNRLGSGLFAGGIGLFLIDQFNNSILQGKKFSLDRGITTTSIIMTGVGLPLKLIKKKSQRIGGKFRLLTAKPGSPFYFEYPEGLYVN